MALVELWLIPFVLSFSVVFSGPVDLRYDQEFLALVEQDTFDYSIFSRTPERIDRASNSRLLIRQEAEAPSQILLRADPGGSNGAPSDTARVFCARTFRRNLGEYIKLHNPANRALQEQDLTASKIYCELARLVRRVAIYILRTDTFSAKAPHPVSKRILTNIKDSLSTGKLAGASNGVNVDGFTYHRVLSRLLCSALCFNCPRLPCAQILAWRLAVVYDALCNWVQYDRYFTMGKTLGLALPQNLDDANLLYSPKNLADYAPGLFDPTGQYQQEAWAPLPRKQKPKNSLT